MRDLWRNSWGGSLIFIFSETIFENAPLVLISYKSENEKKVKPISGRVDRASATQTKDLASIPGWVKPKTIKMVFTASLLDVQRLKGQYEASSVCGRQVGRWQFVSKTE